MAGDTKGRKMNQELKFRAWDGKKWWIVTSISFIEYDPDLVAFYGKEAGYYLIEGIDKDGNRFRGTSIDTKLVEYTGLKDESGKEIFEGDIVKGKWDTTCIIVWDDKELRWGQQEIKPEDNEPIKKVPFIWPLDRPNPGIPEDKKVIGNILENPELLNKGDKS